MSVWETILSGQGFWAVAGSVVGAICGWLLSGLSESRAYNKKIKRNKKALLHELDDILEALTDAEICYEYMIKMYALGGVPGYAPPTISNPIFKNFYIETMLDLPASQCKSYELIDLQLSYVNQDIARIADFIASKKEDPDSVLEDWEGILRPAYHNVRMTLWHVNYHLNNKAFPSLKHWTKEHQQMLEEYKTAPSKVDELIEYAQENMSRSDFEFDGVTPVAIK